MKATSPSEEQEAADFFSRASERIRHEDDLVNQRLTWLVTLQGLLFTAYGFSMSAEAGSLSSSALNATATTQASLRLTQFSENLSSIRFSLAILGVSSAAIAWIGVMAAYRSIKDVTKQAGTFPSERSSGRAIWPPLIGTGVTTTLGMFCGLGVPLVALSAWILVGKLHGVYRTAGISVIAVLTLWSLFFVFIEIPLKMPRRTR